jgi:REP element-mobilizing transposase RayT
MGRRLRFFQGDGFYFVTARTFQARLLLRPDSHGRTNDVLGGVLARAALLYGIEVYAFVAASNHVHLLCRARDGALARFMQYFLGNASKKVGPLVGWDGQLWERRYAVEPVLDDAAMEGRLRYILAHGVKEGLVRSPREWPGLSCLPQLLGAARRVFHFFRWTRRWKGGSLVEGAEDRYSKSWSEEVVLELSPLPHWASLGPAQRRAKIEVMLKDIEQEHQATTKLGLSGVLRQNPMGRPAKPKRTPEPWCHASDPAVRQAFREAYRSFAAAFATASARFRSGELTAHFPPLAFKPFLHPKRCMTPSRP